MTTENKNQELTKTLGHEALEMQQPEPTFEGHYFSFSADIVESDEAVTVLADMPGVSADKLDIDLRDNVLTIMGRVDEMDKVWKSIHSEYQVGGYMRKFTLGSHIDQEQINAKIKDGVLTLVLPKADRLRPRKIQVETV